jgi:hypothetical protein
MRSVAICYNRDGFESSCVGGVQYLHVAMRVLGRDEKEVLNLRQ